MIDEILKALEAERENALAGAEYYAFCKAIDTVRNILDRHEQEDDCIPYKAIGNDELGVPTELVECRMCGEAHEIEYGTTRRLLPDGVTWSEPEPSRTLGFYVCNGKTYLGTVDGRALK